jgi:hypothetical protein
MAVNMTYVRKPWIRGESPENDPALNRQCRHENIHPPVMCPRDVFAKIAPDFQMIVFYFEPKWYTGGFFLPNGTNVVNFSIGTILQWSTLGYCNLNTYENEEVAFIGQRSGEPLKWRPFDEISKDTISKIKYTALSHNLMKLGWNIL